MALFDVFKKEVTSGGADFSALLAGMDEETFLSLYGSLTEDEQDTINDENSVERTQLWLKILLRYIDCANGQTWMGDDGVLRITRGSNSMELPISTTEYLMLSIAGINTINEALTYQGQNEDVKRVMGGVYVKLLTMEYPIFEETM